MYMSNDRFRFLSNYDFTRSMSYNMKRSEMKSMTFVINLFRDLKKDKLVVSEKRGREKIFTLTKKGKEFMDLIKMCLVYDEFEW
jgi:DNA-binding PadR family transcriptional regulator